MKKHTFFKVCLAWAFVSLIIMEAPVFASVVRAKAAYVIPFSEAFAAMNWPTDWTTQVEGVSVVNKWAVSASALAGGSVNEMICTSQAATGTLRLITPPIDTTGYDSLSLRFKNFLETIGVGGVTLKVQTSPDGLTWTDEAWSVLTSSSNIGPMNVYTILTHNLNRSMTYVAFVMSGDFSYLNNWYIDNVNMKAFWSDDLLGTWDGQGVYFRNSLTEKWVKLASPADLITSADLDGDSRDDLVGVWPAQGGVWVRYSQTGNWSKIATTAKHLSSGNMNADNRIDLLGTWDGQGVFYRDSITGIWVKMATPATLVTAGDLDSDGIDDLIGVWPAQDGLWVKYSHTGTWSKLSATALDIVAWGDMNGDGREDLVAIWEGQGVYYRNTANGTWVKMSIPAEQITAGDMDGDGIYDLIGLWTSQGGVFVKYAKTGKWAKLSSPAKDISAGQMRGGFWGSNRFGFVELTGPFGGFAEGPTAQGSFQNKSAQGPGGWRFAYQEQKNLIPKESGHMQRIPGPGDPGFFCTEQKNLTPQERAGRQKMGKEAVKGRRVK
jgi:hypothetical protein